MPKYVAVLPFTRVGAKWKVLLAEETEARGGWSAFGGGPEKRETMMQTALRECDEETHGVLPPNLIKHRLSKSPNSNTDGIVHWFYPADFDLCKMINGVLLRNQICFGETRVPGCGEKRKARWVPLEDVMNPIKKGNSYFAGQVKLRGKLHLPQDTTYIFENIWRKHK